MNKTICIVGSHPRTRINAPWDDESKDIWVLNEAPENRSKDEDGNLVADLWVKRWDALFQIHDEAVYKNPLNFNSPTHWQWLQRDHGKPIYMQDKDPDVPGAVKYPLDEIMEELLSNSTLLVGDKTKQIHHFTSTFPYAMALAIYKGYERIEIYGVELSNRTEYVQQRPGFAFWQGLAVGRGIEFVAHCGENFFDNLMYGYEGDGISLDEEFFKSQYKSLASELRQLRREHKMITKGIKLSVKAGDFDKAGEQIVARQDFSVIQGRVAGKIGETERYLSKLKEVKKATGKAAQLPRDEFELCSAKAAQKGEELNAEMYNASGKTEYVWHTWKLSAEQPELHKLAAAQLLNLQNEQANSAYNYGAHLGIYEFNIKCMNAIDKLIQASGGKKAMEAFSHAEEK